MQTRTVSLASAVPLLLSALLCVAQPASPSSSQTVTASIEDADSGQPLSNARVQVQLFPPEHGARKFLSRFCVPSDNVQPLFTFAVMTDPNGSFRLTAAGGDYLAKITIPQRKPIFGCIFFDTEASVRSCGVDPSSLRIRQHLFIRTANSIPGFSGDILTNSACAPYQPSPCDPLGVPNLVTTKKVMLVDPEGNPIHNAHLEFHEYTKGKGKFIASLTTDANGVADVSSLGGLLRMSIQSERAPGEFLIDFTRDGKPGQQTIKMFHWRCRGNLMQGAMVQR
jgi:hypothetical protein